MTHQCTGCAEPIQGTATMVENGAGPWKIYCGLCAQLDPVSAPHSPSPWHWANYLRQRKVDRR